MLKAKGWLLLCLLPGLWALFFRSPVPIDETRYLTVAWEMWRDHSYLVLHLNGEPYSHKPPLLFWLINAGWRVTGVSDWWPRMVGPLCSALAAMLTLRLATGLWPDRPGVARAAPWILAGSLGWVIFGQMLMFDMLLTLFVLLGALGIWQATRAPGAGPWLLLAVGIGGGLLSKGPIIFVHLLLPAVLVPAWSQMARQRPGRWYLGLLLAAVGGLAIVALWALPAARAGGPAYANAILWGQTAGRMTQSFAHARGWWFYLLILPLMVLPWVAWRPVWGWPSGEGRDEGLKFALWWCLPVFVALSLISGKQPHYLVPLMPVLALLAARAVGPDPRLDGVRRLATVVTGLSLLVATAVALFLPVVRGYDLRAPATAIAAYQARGATVATLGGYRGQFGYLGRLGQDLVEVQPADLAAWAAQHPGAVLVAFHAETPENVPAVLLHRYPYRSGDLYLWHLGGGTAGAPDPEGRD